jgi:tryptophan synthase alpha subunit
VPLRPVAVAGETAPAVGIRFQILSRVIARIESDNKGVPILLKQYLKLGGRLLGFNADDQFSDALDGLIMIDLRASEPRVLARFMGEEGAAAFFAHHGTEPEFLRWVS